MLVACTLPARTWTLTTGDQVEGDFYSLQGDKVFITKADGKKTAIEYNGLIKFDRELAKNMSRIFYDRPPAPDETPNQMRVQPLQQQPAPNKQLAITTEPATHTQPPKNPIAIIPAHAETDQPQAEPQSKQAILKNAVSKVEQTASKLVALEQPTKASGKKQQKKWFKIFKKSLDDNRIMVICVLLLSLSAILKQAQKARLRSSKPYKPKKIAQLDTTIRKEYEKDDQELKFIECPFCKLTNPTSAEICGHCGQYLKI